MQAAGLLKDRLTHDDASANTRGVKAHRPMAKPVLVATITQDNSNVATIIREASDGMRWITTKVKVGHRLLGPFLSSVTSQGGQGSTVAFSNTEHRSVAPGGLCTTARQQQVSRAGHAIRHDMGQASIGRNHHFL